MKILFQENGSTGVYYHRQLVPHVVMQQEIEGIVVERHQNILEIPDSNLLAYDVIVLHGRIDLKVLQLLSRLRKKFVYDVDDYWYATPERMFCYEWKVTDHAQIVEQCINDAAIVTCTSDILAGYIKKHTGVVAHVLPNAIGDKDPQFMPVKTESSRLRFGFIGGSSHVADIAVVGHAIAKLWQNHPEYRDRWQIVYGGFDTNVHIRDVRGVKINTKQKDFPSIKIEKMLTNDYGICDPEYTRQLRQYTIDPLSDDKQYRRIWTMGVEHYGKIINHIDIGFAPLEDNTFNRCKSNLKVIEYGWMGKEVICADLATFKDGKCENDLLMCITVGDYVEAMITHIEHFVSGNRLESNLPEIIRREYNAKNFAQKRRQLYKSIL